MAWGALSRPPDLSHLASPNRLQSTTGDDCFQIRAANQGAPAQSDHRQIATSQKFSDVPDGNVKHRGGFIHVEQGPDDLLCCRSC